MTTPTRPTVTLRAATPEDHAAWWPLWQAYLTFYETTLPDEVSQVTWQRLMDPAEPMHLALAERSDPAGPTAVGLVHYIEHRSCWTTGNYMYLQDLFVHESVRGQGVGRALIEHVYQNARERGCSRVHWLTQEGNATARVLYDRVATRSGFIQYRHIL